MRILRFIKMIACAAVSIFIASSVFAAPPKTLVKRIDKAKEFLDDIMEAPDTEIPAALIEKCRGIVIMRQYKAGFIFGVKAGFGVALARDEKTGQWSPPAFVRAGEGSYGVQIGGQAVDSIFLIMNKEGMEMLIRTKFKLGVDGSVAAGPVGRDASAKLGPGTAILVYSRAKGLYAGATIEGGVILNDDEANQQFYGIKGLTAQDILFAGAVEVPESAKGLINALQFYETRYRKIKEEKAK
ncbi:MAG: lipid-binding SYLF domain-containing protein [Candidatus Omnitrophica bacterium]|nr:lipid-binding SYLF domain-containing protein [Candidatus Omnitrophota bacterium]MCM8789210.1 lipid-binding SYLF domain-containing protein [Candidatus Omnitrophota bacterium]